MQTQPEHPGPSLTVLYIDDHQPSLLLVRHVLGRRPGLVLFTAPRAETGLTLARTLHPNLVLLDLHIPGISGEDVLGRLRADPTTATIPVVMVSADAQPETAARLLDRGARAFLTKPLDFHELRQLLDDLAAEQQPAGAPSRNAEQPRRPEPGIADGWRGHPGAEWWWQRRG